MSLDFEILTSTLLNAMQDSLQQGLQYHVPAVVCFLLR